MLAIPLALLGAIGLGGVAVLARGAMQGPHPVAVVGVSMALAVAITVIAVLVFTSEDVGYVPVAALPWIAALVFASADIGVRARGRPAVDCGPGVRLRRHRVRARGRPAVDCGPGSCAVHRRSLYRNSCRQYRRGIPHLPFHRSPGALRRLLRHRLHRSGPAPSGGRRLYRRGHRADAGHRRLAVPGLAHRSSLPVRLPGGAGVRSLHGRGRRSGQAVHWHLRLPPS